MGLFERITHEIRKVTGAVDAVNGIKRGLGVGKNERFIFASLPQNVEDLKRFPEANLDSPYKTAALAMIALTRFESNKEDCFAMLDFLSGPDKLLPRDKAFIQERLDNKQYVVNSFFAGATVENDYRPTNPYTITVSSNPYSFDEADWAKLFVDSSGADSPRIIRLRRKPSTNQWFIVELQCLSDIRVPKSANPWA